MSWHVRNRYLAPHASWLKGAAGEAFGEFGPFCASEHGPDHGDGRPSPPGDGLGRGDGRNEGSGTWAGRRCRPPRGTAGGPGRGWAPSGKAKDSGTRPVRCPLGWARGPMAPHSTSLPRLCFWAFSSKPLLNVTVG